MANFSDAIDKTLAAEGDLEIDPLDRGGITNFGISFNFYHENIDQNVTHDDIKNLTREQAMAIYQKFFWDPNKYGHIENQKLASKIFDLSVNIGPIVNEMLQEAVNTVATIDVVDVDGIIGSKTIEHINYLPADAIYIHLIIEATHYYTDLVIRHPNQQKYLKGWLRRLHA